MFSTAKSSLHKLQNLNSEKKHHLHESIFSPYLNSNNEDTFIEKLGKPNTKLSHHEINKKSPLHYGEIGIFGAKKYFNEREVNYIPRGSNKGAKKYRHQRDQQIPLETMNYKVQYETPSIRSESTTCNRQSALLQRKSQRNMKNKVPAKSFLAGLCLKCSYSDKDSVDINSNSSSEISFNQTDTYGVAHGKTTPKKISNVGLDANHSVKMNKPHADILMPKKSLEVFGSPIFPSRFEEIDFNYAGSDSSSDLFEIESFREKPNSFFLDRQASDIASSPKSCYTSSEASIEWSVGTASAAVMSDCEEDQIIEETIRSPIRISFSSSNGKGTKGKRDMQQRQQFSNILLGGCKSHLAVSVAGDASFITYEKPSSTSKVEHHRTNISQLPRFPAERKLGNFGARHGQKHPHASIVHSPNASKVLHI
ncbi:hypothetical protein TanjilG_28046 [Lupinus angustifolius]|uniref:Protein PHYTOCHROME KINASE SUBSTRATE 1-like n=1 Tax=Lupinus angustifolius TaxID=3871 RepID=A0A4P1RGL6_LUPAN|nr:PREDICTED: protein PHYTOCHROME KINASE SUBSTRATE 1-like [Lupinus angustifolius]OIW10295.1 hypothetical protein TanjilG_28046 [Lupinus angustifolius]